LFEDVGGDVICEEREPGRAVSTREEEGKKGGRRRERRTNLW